MKKIIILSICTILMLVLFGCQVTPDNQIVQQKDDIKERIDKNNIAEKKIYTAPERWMEKFTEEAGRLTVDINAPISIPQASALAVATERTVFTQEFADNFIKYFIQDKQICKINELKTKKEIEADIVEAQLALEKSNENQNPNDDPEGFYLPIIKKLQKEWKNAPESFDEVIIEKKFKSQDPPDYMIADIFKSTDETDEEYERRVKENEEYKKTIKAQYNENITAIMGRVDLGKEKQAIINITNDKTGNNAIADFSNLGKYKSVSETRVSVDGMKPNNVEMSLETAVSIAENFLRKVEIEDMQFAYAQLGQLYLALGNEKSKDQCYILNFTKTYNDFYETFELTSGMRSEGFNNFRLYERLFFYINDEGILRFSWTNPISYKETLSENVQLISFEKIQEVFRQQIKNIYVWKNDLDVISRTIVIDSITLGLMRVSQPNNSEEYLLIPVWDFFGSEIYQYSENANTEYALDENNQIVEERNLYSFLTINAIDGSIIDRSLGY